MSSKTKQGSWDLPTYNKSGVINFSNPYGSSGWSQGGGVNGGTFGFNFNPQTQDYYNQLETMRKAIYSGLGYTSPARENSLNQWQDTFNKEALRTSQPQLEQSLFARGLGGSKYYSDSLTDLLSKVATQGVLNREELSNRDQQMKLNYLASINPQISEMLNNANALTSGSYGATQQQYSDLMPYLSTWNQPQPGMDWGNIGSLAGLATSVGLAPFTAGASLAFAPLAMAGGQGIGSIFNKGGGNQGGGGGGGLDLSSLASLISMFKSPTTANTMFGANTPIAPADYYKSAAATQTLRGIPWQNA